MAIKTLIFDLDDTLYPVSSGIWGLIGDKIERFIQMKLNLPLEEAKSLRREYYTTYGTALRGLVLNYDIDPEEYLLFVHDVPIEEHIFPNDELIHQLNQLPQHKFIFTNADTRHARRVLAALAIGDCFEDIVDIHKMAPFCKPQPQAFQILSSLLPATPPAECLLLDDSLANIRTASSLGFHALLAGEHKEPIDSVPRFTRWSELPALIDQIDRAEL